MLCYSLSGYSYCKELTMLRTRSLFLLLVILFLAACQPTPLVGTNVKVTVWKDSSGAITALELHPDGRLLATGTAGYIRIWDTQTGQIAFSFQAHDQVTSLAYNREGTYLATGGADGSLRLWDTANNRLLLQPAAFGGSITNISWLKDSTQRLLASSDGDFLIRLVDMNAKGATFKSFKGHGASITGAVYIPNSRNFASASKDRNVIVWDIREGNALSVLTQNAPVNAVQPSPDGKTLAVGLSTGEIRLYGSNPFAKPPTPLGNVFGTTSAVLKLAWNSDGTRLAASYADNTVRVYEPTSGLQVALLVGHTSAPISLIWQGKDRVISADRDGYIRTWEVGSLLPPPGKPTPTPTKTG
jgi:WD40 repeat protein